MRSAWPLNTLPPQHTAQHINQHGILAHVVPSSVGMAQSQTNTNSPAQQLQDDRRRAEHDRMMAVEREQQEQQRYYVSQGVSCFFFFGHSTFAWEIINFCWFVGCYSTSSHLKQKSN